MHDTTISEPALLIRISRLFSEEMSADELYEATRGVWRLGSDRDKVKLAMSVANGTVREVFEVQAWFPAGTQEYLTRPKPEVEIPGRWEFSGRVAPETIRKKYLGCSVSDYLKQGGVNPVTYVNIKP
jgi:hypothetical protein